MSWYMAVPTTVLAVLAVIGGIASIRTGWVLPWMRTRILRPRVFGYAQLGASACLGLQLIGGVLFAGSDAEFFISYSGAVLMLIGLPGLIWAAQRPGRAR